MARKHQRYTRPMTYEMRMQHDDMLNCSELLDPKHKAMLDEGKLVRVGGDAECPVCGEIYYKHPLVVGALWCHEGCRDFLLKL